jgi:hypothetical protein
MFNTKLFVEEVNENSPELGALVSTPAPMPSVT